MSQFTNDSILRWLTCYLYISGMFSIKFLGLMISSVIFFLKCLPVLAWQITEKNSENFPRSQKSHAKHGAIVCILLQSFTSHSRTILYFLVLRIKKGSLLSLQSEFEFELFCKNKTEYCWEQKHMLLFRKSEILHFKVSITNMPHFFF